MVQTLFLKFKFKQICLLSIIAYSPCFNVILYMVWLKHPLPLPPSTQHTHTHTANKANLVYWDVLASDALYLLVVELSGANLAKMP